MYIIGFVHEICDIHETNIYVRKDYEVEAEVARWLIKFWCLYDLLTRFDGL